MQDVSANHTGWGVWGLACQRRNSTRMQNAPKKSANAIFSQDFHHLEGVLMQTLTCRSTGTAVLVLRVDAFKQKMVQKNISPGSSTKYPITNTINPTPIIDWDSVHYRITLGGSEARHPTPMGQPVAQPHQHPDYVWSSPFSAFAFSECTHHSLEQVGQHGINFFRTKLIVDFRSGSILLPGCPKPQSRINPKLSSNRCRLCHASNIFEQRFKRLSQNLKPIGAHQTSTIHSMALPMTVSQKPS